MEEEEEEEEKKKTLYNTDKNTARRATTGRYV